MRGAEVGAFLNTDQSQVSRWERGESMAPKLDRILSGLDRLASHCGVSFEWLCLGRGGSSSTHPNRDAAATYARACGLDPRAVAEVLAVDTPADRSAREWFGLIEAADQRLLFGDPTP